MSFIKKEGFIDFLKDTTDEFIYLTKLNKLVRKELTSNPDKFRTKIDLMIRNNEKLISHLKNETDKIKSSLKDMELPGKPVEIEPSLEYDMDLNKVLPLKSTDEQKVVPIYNKYPSVNQKPRKCSCKKAGCRIVGDSRCKCIECNDGCDCGPACKKTLGLKEKKLETSIDIKVEKVSTQKIGVCSFDTLYIFLDTEGGKTNDLHDLFAILKFGYMDQHLFLLSEKCINLKKDFHKFNDFLEDLKKEFKSKKINLVAWNMINHDKSIIEKIISIPDVNYFDLMKWYKLIVKSDSYKLQNIININNLTIKGTAHTAEYDTLAMIDCFFIAIADYFDKNVLVGEFKNMKNGLLKAYNENNKEKIFEFEMECVNLLNTEISITTDNLSLRNGKTIPKDEMTTLLKFMENSSN